MDSKWLPTGDYKINSVAFQYSGRMWLCGQSGAWVQDNKLQEDAILDTAIVNVAILELSNK